MAKALITGANGFVGKAVGRKMIAEGWHVRGAVRSADAANDVPEGVEAMAIGSINPATDWSSMLDGIDVVIHLAARVHVMNDKATDPLSEFRRVNTVGTRRLARAAVDAGVSRFIYVSSIKVNGEQTYDCPFTEDDQPNPEDAYAISKWEAELSLRNISRETGLEYVVIRPPLVYGPGVKGNFLRILRLVERGIPLPLASVNNRRSFIAIDNLTELIVKCVLHPEAAGQCFLAADGEDLSTAELFRRLACAIGRPSRLLPCPPGFLYYAAKIIGKEAVANRLLGSLRIDADKARRVLGWSPVVTVDEGLARTAFWYKKNQKKS